MLVCDTCDSELSTGLSRLSGKRCDKYFIFEFNSEFEFMITIAIISHNFFSAQKWCIDRGWELIELVNNDRTESEDEEEDDDFPESLGFKRIRQALHANTWSNLIMKGLDV